MGENRQGALPPFDSMQALADYFDTNDMGEHLDEMAEVSFEVDIKRRQRLIAIDAELMTQLTNLAKAQHISAELLINTWLQERVGKAA